MNERFSKRNGYQQSTEIEISVRQEAPHELRGVVVQLAYECGFFPEILLDVLCRLLRKRFDPSSWSNTHIKNEINKLVDNCKWYRVYDIIEGLIAYMREARHDLLVVHQPT